MKKIVYKYLPFTDGSLCILNNSTIKFTCPTNFNDPFDCYPQYDTNSVNAYLLSKKDQFNKFYEQQGLNYTRKLRESQKAKRRLKTAAKDPDNFNSIRNGIGICCFSRQPLNLLMWAHYAKDHTGFVIEFSIPTHLYTNETDLPNKALQILFPLAVNYSKDRYLPIISLIDDPHISMKKFFLTKSLDWEYEQEERCIDYGRGPGIYKFDQSIITGIICGTRMDEENKNTLIAIANKINHETKSNITVYQAKAMKNKFELYKEELENI